MPWHPHVSPDPAWRGPVPDRTISSMRLGPVSSWLARESVLFHHTLKPFSLGTANDIDKFTRLKLVHANTQISVHLHSVRQSKFPDKLLRFGIRFLEMP